MPAVFVPPTVVDLPWVNNETPALARRLFRYYVSSRGRSVVLVGGHYTTVDSPDQLLLEGLEEGSGFFLGGHEYVVSDAIASLLLADGYGGAVDVGGTWGSHSSETWGDLPDSFWAGV